MRDKNFLVQIFGGTWHVYDFFCRLVIDLFITFVVIVILVAVFVSHKPAVPSPAALVVNLRGDLVDQYSGDPAQRAVAKLLGQKVTPQTRLRDVIAAIKHARKDDRIKALVLETDELEGGGFLGGAGLSNLQDIGRAIRDFRKSGKPVFALGDSYDQSQYYLASMANTVFIHPQGQVFLHGYGLYQPYFKNALDKLGVEVHVFRVGKYKSAVEPFIRNDMSPDARRDWSGVLDSLWGSYRRDVRKARDLKPGVLTGYVDDIGPDLAAVGGNAAELALKTGLVDKIADDDQMQAAVEKVVGRSGHSFRQIGFEQYLHAVDGESAGSDGANAVGVVVAQGDIVDGNAPPGAIGGDSTARLIAQARYDAHVKALVLRVNSPGGSAFASDLILRQIELTREAGKPVVVSMGDVAASGGYWISMAGDEIYANPTTITGSIGIFGLFPTFQKTLAKIGVHTDGVGSTPLSGAFNPLLPMSPAMQQAFQLTVNYGYQQFITKVAKFRHLPVAQVNAIGQGYVWPASEARKIGLVDKFGGLQDAIAAAARLAKLGPHYGVQYLEKPLSLTDRLLIEMANNGNSSLASSLLPQTNLYATPWYNEMKGLADTLNTFTDPRGIYAFCFCNVR